MILVSIPMFLWSRNAIRTVPTALDRLAKAVSLNFKMAATMEETGYTKMYLNLYIYLRLKFLVEHNKVLCFAGTIN